MTLASGLDAGASAGAHALARYRSEFPIFRDAVYLNTCSLGALGDRTRRRVAEFFDLWQARGASAWYDVWWAALVATSHVYFTSGAIQDIEHVADAARKCGALTLVDAYQSVGQVPVDVKAAGVDFLTAGGLKWLLGGPGIVLLYVRDELARRLAPAIAGWFGHKDQFAFSPRVLELHEDARPGHVRLSPFFYNVQDDHVSALERLATHTGH